MKIQLRNKTYFNSEEFKISSDWFHIHTAPAKAKETFSWTNIRKFVTDTSDAIYNKVREWVLGIYQHAEAIAVVTLAGIGATALLSELPFLLTLPMWIESPMVIPVVGVIIVMVLLRSSEWRAKRRLVVRVA